MAELLQNERIDYVKYRHCPNKIEHFCPFCRAWCLDWGGGTVYRGRKVCPSCSFTLPDKRQEKFLTSITIKG